MILLLNNNKKKEEGNSQFVFAIKSNGLKSHFQYSQYSICQDLALSISQVGVGVEQL